MASRSVPEMHVTVTDVSRTGRRTHITVGVENAADIPVFPVCLSIMDSGVRDVAEDNFFWLDPGEKRTLRMVADSLPGAGKTMTLKVSAWNCPEQSIRFSEDEEV